MDTNKTRDFFDFQDAFVSGFKDVFSIKKKNDVNAINAAKETELSLAGEQDDNDQHFKRHLMQLQFDHLSFKDIATRVDASKATLDRLTSFGSKTISLHEKAGKHYGTIKYIGDTEFPGSMLDGLSRLDYYHKMCHSTETTIVKEIKQNFVDPMNQLKQAHQIHTSSLLRQHDTLDKKLEVSRLKFKRLQQSLAQSVKEEQIAQKKCEAVAKEAASMVGGGTAESEAACKTAQRNWQQAIDKCKLLLKESKEKEEELKFLEKEGKQQNRKLALEIQLSEQNRVDASRISLSKMIMSEIQLLEKRKSFLSNILVEVNAIDKALDTRLYSHLCIVESYLRGDIDTTEVTTAETTDLLNHDEVLTINDTMSEIEIERIEHQFEMNRLCKQIEDYLNWVFHPKEKEKPCSIGDICDSLEHGTVRRHLLRTVNLFRSGKTYIQEGFDELVVLFVAVLDTCYVNSDIKTAKMASIMTDTFYCLSDLDDENSKVYIQDRVKSHAIWQSSYFWEEAFLFSVREEVEKNLTRKELPLRKILASYRQQLLENSYASFSAIAGINSEEVIELFHMYQQIVFCQIGSYAYNMRSFELDPAAVKRFIQSMCNVNCITLDQEKVLLANVK